MVTSPATRPTPLPVRSRAHARRALRSSFHSRRVTRGVITALQYAAAITCLVVLTWVVMLLVYAPFARMH